MKFRATIGGQQPPAQEVVYKAQESDDGRPMGCVLRGPSGVLKRLGLKAVLYAALCGAC